MPWFFFSCPGPRVSAFAGRTVFGYSAAHLTPKSARFARRLSAGAPDVLEVAVTLGEAVDAVVGLAHGADEAAEGVGLGLAGVSAVLVDLGDADLNRAVVLGLDDAVGCAALAGDVTARKNQPLVCPLAVSFFLSGGVDSYRSTSSPRSFSMVTVL